MVALEGVNQAGNDRCDPSTSRGSSHGNPQPTPFFLVRVTRRALMGRADQALAAGPCLAWASRARLEQPLPFSLPLGRLVRNGSRYRAGCRIEDTGRAYERLSLSLS